MKDVVTKHGQPEEDSTEQCSEGAVDARAVIEDVLSSLRPMVQADGGDIELVSFIDGIVSVRLHGACVHCPISIYTLKMGVEQSLREALPGRIKEVVQVA